MKTTQIIQYSLAASLGLLPLGCTKQAQPEDSSEARALQALVERWNLAVTADTPEKGVELARSVLSDKGYVIVQSNRWTTDPAKMSEALVGNGPVMCDLVAQSLRTGPKWVPIKFEQLTIAGPIAYEIVEVKDRPDAMGPTTWFNVLAREDVGWRMVFSTPAEDFKKAMRQLDDAKGKPAK